MNEQYINIRSLTLKQVTYALAAADADNVTAACIATRCVCGHSGS